MTARVLNIFLPVHNRASITSAFVDHLKSALPPAWPVRLWVLDDGCTDHTLQAIQDIWPAYCVVSLGGRAYWGGALNAICSICRNGLRHFPIINDELVMVCNDDIRFGADALSIALHAVNSESVVFASSQLEQFDASSRLVGSFHAFRPQEFCRFDSRIGKFFPASNIKDVNVASTYALIAPSSAWAAASVPRTVPHYLSDYWVTYQMYLAGYRIDHPKGFHCYVSDASTRNKPELVTQPQNSRKNHANRLLHAVKRRLASAAKSADLLDPGYPLAWASFLRICEPPKISRISFAILKLQAKFGVLIRAMGMFVS